MPHAPSMPEEASGTDTPAAPEEPSDTEERNNHVQREEEQNVAGPKEPPAEDGTRETTEPRLFTVVRRADESGVSGIGRVLDGCIFHNGQVVVCWRGDINSEKSGYASLAIYPCWEAFQKVHIDSHPENETEVVFGQGADLMSRLIDQAAEPQPSAAGQPELAETEEAETEEGEAEA